MLSNFRCSFSMPKGAYIAAVVTLSGQAATIITNPTAPLSTKQAMTISHELGKFLLEALSRDDSKNSSASQGGKESSTDGVARFCVRHNTRSQV